MLSSSPLIDVLFLVVFLVFLAGWTRALLCLKHGRPILVTEPRPLPRGSTDTLLLGLTLVWVLAMFVVAVVVYAQFVPVRPVTLAEMTPYERIEAVQLDMFGKIAAFIATLPLVALRFAPRMQDLRPQWHKVPRDLAIGVVGFCMLAVPVLLIKVVLTSFFPQEHPFIEVLQETADPEFLIIAGLSAVIVAPIAEEFFFRVLLQGLLERLSLRPGWQLLVEAPPANPAEHHGEPPAEPEHTAADPIDHSRPPGAEETLEPLAEPAPPREVPSEHAPPVVAAVAAEENPFVAPAIEEVAPPTAAERLRATTPAYWPIAVSSLIFALVHVGQGPAPIALFFFALGLGYVYRATHRVLPCIVIHFLLNGFSMLQLWVMMQ